MLRKALIGTAIAGVLALGIPTAALAQTSEAKQDMKKAGSAMKQAGKSTAEAAKETGKATKHTAKAVKHKITGKKVAATCNDGTTYSGRTRRGACSGHGGVKSWNKA